MRYCKFCECEHPLTTEFWYRLDGSPKCKKRHLEIRRANYDPEKMSEYNREYRSKHKERLAEANAEWRRANAEHHKANARSWYHSNKERAHANHAAYTKKRKAVDPCFKLAVNLRSRMYRVLRGINKVGSAVRDLGCSLSELREHLEQQFHPGMSWDNYGSVWEVDHILPLANYKLDDRGTYRRLAHYTNLQPLLISENRAKLNRER